jgi:hypothetical protein
MLTGKTIGELTQLTVVDNSTKFLVESGSATYYSNYSDIVDGFATTDSNSFTGNQTINGLIHASASLSAGYHTFTGGARFIEGQVSFENNNTVMYGALNMRGAGGDSIVIQNTNVSGSGGLFIGTSNVGIGYGSKYVTPTIATLMVSGSMYLEPYDGDGLQTGSALPLGQRGEIAVSGSNLFFHNGTMWKQVTLT